jgi:oligopeptide/dipeptide ABC transporter ATP-binding protein
MSALLRLQDLTVRLPVEGKLRTVVDGVSLEVAAGETVALVGESGAGKSMIGRAIGRLLPPGAEAEGRLEFEGTAVAELDRRALRRFRGEGVGFVFQDPRAAINPVRKIGDFLTEALVTNRNVSRAEARRRVSELLVEVGIGDPERRLRQYPHELSGGLLQRVMIASVLAMRPKLIVADEPTTALDVTTQSEVMAILAEMQERLGIAMLLITHDLELAAAVCRRTAVLYAGTLVEERPSASLEADPLHPYTAALLTSRPSLASAAERLQVIRGRPLSALEAPPGCPFTSRCSYAKPICEASRPPLRALADGHVACVRAEELRGAVWPLPEAELEEANGV